MANGAQQNSSQIIKNVLMNWLSFATTILAGFLMAPFLVRNLGDSVYGVWVLIGSLVGYLGLLDFGLSPSTVKYVAQYHAQNDQAGINRVVTCGLAVYTVMGLIGLGVSGVVALRFNDIFNTPLADNIAAVVVMLAGLNLALTFPSMVFVGVVRGYQRYDLDAFITSVTIIVRSLLVVVFIRRGYGILALSGLTLAFDAMRLAFLVCSAFRLNPNIKIGRAYFDREEMRRLFGFSVYVFLIIISHQVIFYTDSMIIGIFLTTAAVTAYSIASRLVTYLQMLVSEMVGVLAPTTSALHATNDHEGIRELLVRSTKYVLLISLPVATVYFALGDRFIALWMGPEFSGSWTVLAILTTATLFHLFHMPAYTVLLGMGKHRFVAWVILAQAITNLVLSIVLVGPFGMLGVAIGTAIPMISFTLFALVFYFRSVLKLSFAEYLRQSLPLPILMQIPFIVALLLLRTYSPPTSFMRFFSEITIAFVPYSLLAFRYCLSAPERQAFLRFGEKFGLKRAREAGAGVGY